MSDTIPEFFHVQTQKFLKAAQKSKVVRIGRRNQRIQPDIDVSNLPNAAIVSRIHADIIFDGYNWVIQDAGSTNGTYLNNDLLISGNRYCLSLGDRIGLGHPDLVTFLFLLHHSSSCKDDGTTTASKQSGLVPHTALRALNLMAEPAINSK